jgi:hypothetical protein
VKKQCATEAAQCLQKMFETGAAPKGEARQETQNPTNNRLKR